MNSANDEFAEALRHLREEGDAIERIVRDLDYDEWRLPTPAQGWTIAHQIAHLAWTDGATLATLSGDDSFAPYLREARDNPTGLTDDSAAEGAAKAPEDLLAVWTEGRGKLEAALSAANRRTRFTWFGPPMKARSLITARNMETWAHGQDIADALGAEREDGAALRDVAHLGVITRDFAYRINGLEPPAAPFRVTLAAPDGDTWTWGPADATDSVTGTARDFCLLVTQRREPGELALDICGSRASEWARIAQAFAGPPKSVVRAAHDAHNY